MSDSTDFEVWAPKAASMALVADGVDVPMHQVTDRTDPGWWAASTAKSPRRYGFRVDGAGSVVPDPNSRRQPDGVHGLSAPFDPAVYQWGDTKWTGRQLSGGVIYEMHVGTFTSAGTLEAATDKLDHLVDIGVDFVELLPVNGFNGTHNWGYDGVAWYTVHEGYGGPEAYQRFVDACHQRGLAVIQDVVYNHLGPSGNYLPQFGPYLHEGRANTWGSSMNLDGPHSDPVRRYIIDNALMWLGDYHVDGLRLDAVHALVDHRAVHLLTELAAEVDALSAHVRRPLSLIAESDMNDPRMISSRQAGGHGMTAQWNDDFHHVLHVALTDETVGYYSDFGSMSAIAKVLTRAFYHDGTYSSFRGRRHGRPVDLDGVPGSAFVVFTQDHDQIGNRAAGDRLSAQLDQADLAIAAVLLFTSPFTPMLFMGEEWAASTPWQFFTSHPETELAEATAKGRLDEFASMGWDPEQVPNPQDPETFQRSTLDWSELEKPEHAVTLDLYRRLALLRREYADLSDPRLGRVTAEFDDDERWLLVGRGSLRIAVNFAPSGRRFPITGEVLLATADDAEIKDGHLLLPPRSAAVVKV